MPEPSRPLSAYPSLSFDKLRYGDTDRQGHVNNAVFTTMLETGRVGVIYPPGEPLADSGASWVIARLTLDFLGEVTWPGQVDIGTGVLSIGRSSITFDQAVFQDDRPVARAQSVVVQVDDVTRRGRPLSESARRRLEALALVT